MSPSAKIELGMLSASIGMGYIVYGIKQQSGIAFLSGFALVAYPCFVANVILVILIGIVRTALPFIMKY